ncbi:class I SAM-dependent methyltransferase [Haladaptatus salinisoli]|uniref:class I SAM-dependent methyltransferase n=1 Tax=Haladaptatus salinisoli TaxID=2884876 RepID=UPI001D0BCC32|nr:class I SAM-dependent methyltransferase [Haladaptatus salinisoli]
MDPDENLRGWAERSGEFSPAYYAQIGSNEVSETLATVFEYYVREDAAILEVGCSSGRHLAHLRDNGFKNLTGIDINDESFDVMADQYPKLAATGTFYTGAIENVLSEFSENAFDVIYSVETLQHIHPENARVFDELARVTSDLLITAENEGNSPQRGREGAEMSYVHDEFPIYYRDWERVFSDLGLAQLVCEPSNRDTVRVFRVP